MHRLTRRLSAASAEGRDVHWLRSYALPEDETCLCVFAAGRRADVEEANRRAGSAYERILEAHPVGRPEEASSP